MVKDIAFHETHFNLVQLQFQSRANFLQFDHFLRRVALLDVFKLTLRNIFVFGIRLRAK